MTGRHIGNLYQIVTFLGVAKTAFWICSQHGGMFLFWHILFYINFPTFNPATCWPMFFYQLYGYVGVYTS